MEKKKRKRKKGKKKEEVPSTGIELANLRLDSLMVSPPTPQRHELGIAKKKVHTEDTTSHGGKKRE